MGDIDSLSLTRQGLNTFDIQGDISRKESELHKALRVVTLLICCNHIVTYCSLLEPD